MDQYRVAGGIVLYNPDDRERLSLCIRALQEQVDTVYVFDNSTQTTDYEFPEQFVYITEHENKGIAYALNRIMEHAMEDGFSWVLTMDQDSILPDGMVADFISYIEMNSNIGIICPQVIDKRREYMKADESEGVQEIDDCITSASCMSVSVWKQLGGLDEWLFIDLVDNEFCKRLRVSGYRILQVKKWVLDQEFGKIAMKSERERRFWIRLSQILHNKNIAKFSYKKTVVPMRVYYTCRNIIYVNRKMAKYGRTAYANYNCKGYPGFIISFVLPSILRADDKVKVCKAAWSGTVDGHNKKVAPWIAEHTQ